MYEKTVERFGSYDKYTFFDRDWGQSMSIVPACGGCLVELILKGQSILDAYTSPEEMDTHKKSKSEWLVPFPNRLMQGQYTFEGVSYQFPKIKRHMGHAIHGFVIGEPMVLHSVQVEPNQVRAICRYDYDGSRPYYPFPFRLDICYQLHSQEGLTIELSLTNRGTSSLPIGLGWHPYFTLGPLADEWTLQLPDCRKVLVNELMIPSGETQAYDHFRTASQIGARSLDNCFVLTNQQEGEAEIHLSDGRRNLQYWQETGPGKFNYFQLFVPPTRHSIAIEPMSCNVDAFNNRQGLVVLSPDEQMAGKFGLRMTQVR
ncbi:MAG: hypothetical protein AAFV25_02615 [Bacteroidota bacterium]